jgi:reactive intermediate/imine deaminase
MSKPEFFPSPMAGYPISEAVRVGDTVYLSGQLGLDRERLVSGFEAQAEQAMKNVGAALARLGLGFEHVVKCTVMLQDIGKLAAFNRIYANYFSAGQWPARSAFAGTELALGAEVEVECIAVAS